MGLRRIHGGKFINRCTQFTPAILWIFFKELIFWCVTGVLHYIYSFRVRRPRHVEIQYCWNFLYLRWRSRGCPICGIHWIVHACCNLQCVHVRNVNSTKSIMPTFSTRLKIKYFKTLIFTGHINKVLERCVRTLKWCARSTQHASYFYSQLCGCAFPQLTFCWSNLVSFSTWWAPSFPTFVVNW